VEFTDHDVSTDRDALDEMRQLTQGGLSVPVIKICDDVIVGFDQNRIEESLTKCLGTT
jgi:hypothetical protein